MLQLLPTLRSEAAGPAAELEAAEGQAGTTTPRGLDGYAIGLQIFMSEVIQSLLRNEKNQQLMCDVEFLSKILVICKAALEDDNHVLNSPFQYLLERLAAQKLESSDLKTFLRLGHPLACLNGNEQYEDKSLRKKPDSAVGNIVPLTRIKTIVSMTTPRHGEAHMIQNNSILPPFIELDMASEGFGCIFLPSMAPTSAHSVSVVGK